MTIGANNLPGSGQARLPALPAMLAGDIAQHLNDARLFDLLHARKERERDGAGKAGFSVRKHPFVIAQTILIQRMEMQGYEMNRGADAAVLEFFDDAIAADGEKVVIHLNDVEMPSVLNVIRDNRGEEALERIEFARVAICQGDAEPAHVLSLFELDETDRGLQVREIVFIADVLNVVAPCAFGGVALPRVTADTMHGKNAHAIGKRVVLRGNHAAFACGDGFRGVEGETGDVANGAYRRSLE